MATLLRRACVRLLCCGLLVVCPAAASFAAAQAAGADADDIARIKDRLERPAAPRLAPKEPVQLRPTFRSRVTDRPFVPTLEEHLQKTFALTDFQRKYAEYAGKCCGLDLGALFRGVDQALYERKVRKASAQVAREIAEIEAARRPR